MNPYRQAERVETPDTATPPREPWADLLPFPGRRCAECGQTASEYSSPEFCKGKRKYESLHGPCEMKFPHFHRQCSSCGASWAHQTKRQTDDRPPPKPRRNVALAGFHVFAGLVMVVTGIACVVSRDSDVVAWWSLAAYQVLAARTAWRLR